MRTSIAVAAGLFALNLAVVIQLSGVRSPHSPATMPAPSFGEPPIAVRETAIARDTAMPELASDAFTLAQLWSAAHPGDRLPPCHLRDPVATLDVDIESTPGREHIIGNRRLGIAMFAEAGELIAWMEPVQCFGYAGVEDQSLSLGTIGNTLVASERMAGGRPGEMITAYVIERHGDRLIDVAMIDLGGDRQYYEGEWQVEGKLHLELPDMITVVYHGRFRPTGEREWRGVDAHCRWQRFGDELKPIDPESVCHNPH
jgi:hypothetical protein